MERKITLLTSLVVISLLLQVLFFIVQTVNIRSQQADAYSVFGGGYLPKPDRMNCFDASLNGPQVMKCLGIPSGDTGRAQPSLYTPTDSY
jgi:hypothetical protein